MLIAWSDSDDNCQLPGEPQLVPDQLHAMDGNNSMKQVDGSGHNNDRVFSSNYLIPLSKVYLFKDDIQTHLGTKPSNDIAQFDENTICTEHWSAANAVSEGTVEVFQQTGGFLATCHHSIIETFVEMRNSGEL